MAYKPVRIVALENEQERLQKMEAKITSRLAEIAIELEAVHQKEAEKKQAKKDKSQAA